MRVWSSLLLMGMVGCASDSSAVWLESAGYKWRGFNHRVSHWTAGVDDQGVYLATVGGTSTTGLPTELPEGCAKEICDEFPIMDPSDNTFRYGEVTTSSARFGTTTAELVVGLNGASMPVTIPMPDGVKGDPSVMIRGFTIDTNQPLTGGTDCYDGQRGWLPRRMHLELAPPVVSGDSVTTQFSATFVAGLTFEDERQCLDAVIDQAQVRIAVDVLAVTTKGASETQEVQWSQSHPLVDGELPEPESPDPASRTTAWTVESPMVGWSKLDYRFHLEDPSRGAYIREINFEVDGNGLVSGHATNKTVGATQLSGFDYTFYGTAVAVDAGATPVSTALLYELDAVLDENGDAVLSRFDF